MKTVGVLALQGGFARHAEKMQQLGTNAIEVRCPKDLEKCEALILPGGESTTIRHLLLEARLYSPLKEFALEYPLFGTCAGMIIMAKEKWIDLAIERNAYGRQAASFSTEIKIHLGATEQRIEAIFIRAPKIKAVLSKEVEILAIHQGEPVLIRQGKHLAASFHPELTETLLIHKLFLEQLNNQVGAIF